MRSSRQTHTQETAKLTKKKNRTEKNKRKRAKCNHVQENPTKAAKQIPSGI
jgi:hypothetical protein